jgi:serine/threonine protein kinase
VCTVEPPIYCRHMSSVREAIRGALHQLIGDKYQILGWIGGGGMADVFLAKNRGGKSFAVKVLSDALASDQRIVMRFHEEIKTAARLDGHANIVQIFEDGEGAGLHYIIMSYVEGADLTKYIEHHGRLTNEETIYVARQIADALAWAASLNVVHRDLKPSNVRIDRSERVMVLDFGISKAMDVPTGLTTRGETMGTPYYMSPEQVLGEPCDARSDLYSLGVMIFEMLAGRKPYDGDNLRKIEMGHLEGEIPPLPADAHPVLAQLVYRLLQKNKDHRPSPAEVVETLRGLGLGRAPRSLDQPSSPRPPEPAPTPTPAPSRTAAPTAPTPGGLPKLLLPALGGVAVAVAAFGYWIMTREPAPKPAVKTEVAEPSFPPTVTEPNGTLHLVPAGKFIFGDDAPESPNPRREMELPAYYIEATEVSNEQYLRFAQATGRKAPEGEPRLPVTDVTLEDAKAYCAWAGRRVPTEPEWEKAARGPDGRVYPWGNEAMKSPGTLVPVDDLNERQSPYRALNMAGNVMEWTVSPFPVTDREIADMAKLTGQTVSRDWANIKGGSFMQKDERFFRLYLRRGWPVNQGSPYIGIRCVKDAKP